MTMAITAKLDGAVRSDRAGGTRRSPRSSALPPGRAGGRGPRKPYAPLKATAVCLRRTFDYGGRARRDEYWGFAAVAGAALAALAALDFGFASGPAPGLVTGVAALMLAPTSISAGWRRMHDIDRPGWVSVLHLLILAAGELGAVAVAVSAGDGGLGGDVETPMLLAAGLPVVAALIAWVFVTVRLARPTWPRNNRWGKTPNV